MRKGITLVELLVALAVMGVLIVAFVRFFASTLSVTNDFDRRNELLSEGQIAHQLITSRLQEAWHVYPAGTSITLTVPSAWQATNPATSNTTWAVGPTFVAVILPPVRVSAACNPGASPAQTAGCYRFVAYYPITRSSYVTGTASDLANRLPADGGNPNAWVLMQYSGFLPAGTVTASSTTPPASVWANLQGVEADLLADYLTQNSQPFALTQLAAGPPATQQITVNLQLSRAVRGRTFSAGGSNTSLNTVVQSRNQGVAAP